MFDLYYHEPNLLISREVIIGVLTNTAPQRKIILCETYHYENKMLRPLFAEFLFIIITKDGT